MIFVNIKEREILAYHYSPLDFCWKDHIRVEFNFPRGSGPAAEPVFPYVWQS